MAREEIEGAGHAGTLRGYRWSGEADPSWVAVLVHGYGEHVGRYEHVAARLVDDGAVVYAQDHVGHGRSDGERVLVEDFEPVVDDVRLLVRRASEEHPGLPIVLIGHSMGGMIAARYTQRFPEDLTAMVLSGPVLGRWAAVEQLLPLEEIPATPIDPDTLSRDPEVGKAYDADELVWHGDFKRPTLAALAAEIDTINDAGALAVPTLWLHGEEDQLVPIDDSRDGWARIRGEGSEERTYPGARHEIFNETNQDEVLDDVLAFVRRHLGRS